MMRMPCLRPKMSGNALEHVVSTYPLTGMPSQATGQSGKLIFLPC
jgi:hypothetical protein